MILRVPLHTFPETVLRVLGIQEAYIEEAGSSSHVTAGTSGSDVILSARSTMSLADTTAFLTNAGIRVFPGRWETGMHASADYGGVTLPYIGAVAYHSGGEQPGVWVDTYPEEPAEMAILEAMYAEFVTTGQVEDVPLELFIQLAKPTVVIVSPTEIREYLAAKQLNPVEV